MSARPFTVFTDTTPDVSTSKPTSLPKLKPSTSSSNILAVLSGTHTPVDKENYNPLTGERAGSSSTAGKKRKGSVSNVLATKVYAPSDAKLLKGKDSSEAQPEAKKRKSSASASSSKPKAKKDAKTLVLGRKIAKKSSRRTSPLPKVDEEVGVEEKARITQIRIDSKCYDFTVSPLADVSEAYNELPLLDTAVTESPAGEKAIFQFVKEASADPEIRDYFDPQISVSSSSITLRGSSPDEPKTFSTPERKQLYAAFTFTSPSPTSARFHKKSARAGSIPRLDLGDTAKVSP